MKNSTFLIAVLSSFSLGNLQAATIHSEMVNGELSSDSSAPTQLGTLALGDNDIIGQIGGDARDYFTFTLASGQTLDSITLVSGTGTNHFFGLDDQATFDNNASSLLIATLFSGTVTESPDFLDTFAGGGAFGGSGVSGSSLGAGDYTILVNETASTSSDYQLRLTAVPEPSSSSLLGLAGIAALIRRRR